MQRTLTAEAATNRTPFRGVGGNREPRTENKNEDRRSFSSGNVLSLSHVCECTCRSSNVATKHGVGRLHANVLRWKTLFRSFGFLFLRQMSSGNMSCSPRRLQDSRYSLSSLGLCGMNGWHISYQNVMRMQSVVERKADPVDNNRHRSVEYNTYYHCVTPLETTWNTTTNLWDDTIIIHPTPPKWTRKSLRRLFWDVDGIAAITLVIFTIYPHHLSCFNSFHMPDGGVYNVDYMWPWCDRVKCIYFPRSFFQPSPREKINSRTGEEVDESHQNINQIIT